MAEVQSKILLVTENSETFAQVKDAFRMGASEPSLSHAANVSEALRQLEKEPPDVIIVDYALSGDQFWRLARSNRDKMTAPLIGLVDDETDANDIPGLEAGLLAVVTKDPGELRKISGRARRVRRDWDSLGALTKHENREIDTGATGGAAPSLSRDMRLRDTTSRLDDRLMQVLAFAELAVRDLAGQKSHSPHLYKALDSAREARRLVWKIIAAEDSRPEHQESIDLRRLVEDILDSLSTGLPAAITVETQLDRRASGVRGDAAQLHRMIENLIVNAVEAMPSGGQLRVSLAEEEKSSGGTQLRVKIADQGVGISPDNLDKVFLPLFTTKTETGEFGLGLTVAREIALKHAGRIDIHSQEGSGTTVGVVLPAGRSEVQEPRPAIASMGTPTQALIVSDDTPLLNQARLILESEGIGVDIRFSPSEALVALSAYPGRYRLLIIDGDRSGEHYTKSLLGRSNGTRTVVVGTRGDTDLTDYDSTPDKPTFIQKPLSDEVLAPVLASLNDRST